MITPEDFQKLDIRVGRIVSVDEFPASRKPAYKLNIDFGELIGTKKSCAQLKQNYTKSGLMGRLVLCVINFPPKQIGPEISEVLTLGIPDKNNNAILVRPDQEIPLGGKLY